MVIAVAVAVIVAAGKRDQRCTDGEHGEISFHSEILL
jgi:hypothetical protein